MSFFPLTDAWELACLLQHHDANCRNDLANSSVTSERDYVSNLATHIRYPTGSIADSTIPAGVGLGIPNFKGKITSFTLPPSSEQILGFDGIIILSLPSNNAGQFLHKVGLFEAKWPRTFGGHPSLGSSGAVNLDDWDNARSGESHFSRQLITQNVLDDMGLVLWEQFFSEQPVAQAPIQGAANEFYKSIGSTCVLHHHAHTYMRSVARLDPDDTSIKNGSWKWKHLSAMFQQSPTLSFRLLIFLMAGCFIGKPFPGNRSEVRLKFPDTKPQKLNAKLLSALVDNELIISIPSSGPDSAAAVHKAMRDFGLTSYMHISLDQDAVLRAEAEELSAERRRKLSVLLSTL